jgi:glycosyltransferase involved in cell wall biosynthesis
VKIVFVSAHASQGGVEQYERLLLGELDRDWIERVVFLAHGPFPGQLRAAGYPVTVLPTSQRAVGILRSALRLRRLLRAARPDVVHADGIKAGLAAVLATLAGGPPVVWVKHDFSWEGRLVRLVARRARIVVAVSSALSAGLGNGARARTRVIHNGIPPLTADPESGRRTLDESFGPSPRSRTVVLFGRLSPIKGHSEVLAVAASLRKLVPDVRIAFVGGTDPFEPEHEQKLRREARDRGVGDVVSFLGFAEAPHDLVAASDVLVLPTVVVGRRGKEGFPFVGLESMAVGTPVVAYAQGGLPEQLGDSGVLVPPGDRDALRDALARVLQDDDLREQLAARGRKRVAERFSVARMVDAMKECYRDAAPAARD